MASMAAPAQPVQTDPPAPIDANKYRGATVEDLDLPPALSITPTTPIATALAMCYDRDYSQLTVVSPSTRALLGYLSVPRLKALLASPAAGVKETDTVDKAMHRFDRRKGVKVYKVITPSTGLEELEEFLRGEEFAVVTDAGRRFVLGVATRGDLVEFVRRRPG
ncbi:uncharacterized protein H6S33_001357 [Morchella sextelata]|uniref:uncharacterized protein n=1 Tax=Morchella sextelata TaxID=1174677 RepID=UPI001D03FA8A|nr:uncharacterized protein H6S33_001357 [Morchella sextelata]KAH0609129.1 hypothetical protein H6S33_001357 [Morchella sextelata]